MYQAFIYEKMNVTMVIYSSTFLLLDFTRVALHDSQFKINLILTFGTVS